MPKRILLTCPTPKDSTQGNSVTAMRWARILRGLGHHVRVATPDAALPVLASKGGKFDILLALHARKSSRAVRAFRARHPDRPLVVAFTGTDLYHDLGRSAATRRSLELADRLILLQPAGLQRLPPAVRRKAVVIFQSVSRIERSPRPPAGHFRVCVLANLRSVKDPLRTAMAVRSLPTSSRIHVVHLGEDLDHRLGVRARKESAENDRYRWLGSRPRTGALRWLASSRLMVLSSRMEGGANVIGEAAVHGVPILASRIEGTLGLLGARHPGLFEVGDTRALRDLLLRAESDAAWYARLKQASRKCAALFRPARERAAWRELMRGLASDQGAHVRKPAKTSRLKGS